MSQAADKPASKFNGDLKHRHRVEKSARMMDPVKNPCIKEQEMSLKCLDNNGYDRDECSKYFQNYKNCRTFWRLVTLERRQKGIQPNLPPVEERVRAMEDYKHIMGWK